MKAVRCGKWVAYQIGGGQMAKSQVTNSPAPATIPRRMRRSTRFTDQGVPEMVTRKEPLWSAVSDWPTAGTVMVTLLDSVPSRPAGTPLVPR